MNSARPLCRFYTSRFQLIPSSLPALSHRPRLLIRNNRNDKHSRVKSVRIKIIEKFARGTVLQSTASCRSRWKLYDLTLSLSLSFKMSNLLEMRMSMSEHDTLNPGRIEHQTTAIIRTGGGWWWMTRRLAKVGIVIMSKAFTNASQFWALTECEQRRPGGPIYTCSVIIQI